MDSQVQWSQQGTFGASTMTPQRITKERLRYIRRDLASGGCCLRYLEDACRELVIAATALLDEIEALEAERDGAKP